MAPLAGYDFHLVVLPHSAVSWAGTSLIAYSIMPGGRPELPMAPTLISSSIRFPLR